MLVRIISGLIAAAILVGLILLPPYVLALTALGASIIGLTEFSRAMKNKGINIDLGASCIASVIIMGKAYGATLPVDMSPGVSDVLSQIFATENLNTLVYLIIVYLFLRIIFQNGSFKMEDMAFTMFGIAYIPFLLSFAVMTRNLDRGIAYIWLIIIGGAITDICAYFTGVAFGKVKIIPHISPKKTVEGSIGGAVGCMLVMMLYGYLFLNGGDLPAVPLYHMAIMGLLCGIVSQFGDWAASAIKRNTGIKDYGKLIPGHGGIMDRADSLLFVAPLVYIYVKLFL